MSLWQRVKYSMVEPDDDPVTRKEGQPVRPVEEIQEDLRRSNDKERTIGLVAAPVAAIVGIAISTASINYARTLQPERSCLRRADVRPPRTRRPDPGGIAVAQAPVSGDHGRTVRSGRLPVHYTYVGFAAPFILVGAWYMVRAYRLQQELERSEADVGGVRRNSASPSRGARPRPNKRCTPPT